MIVAITMYSALCNNCGKRWSSDEGHIAYTDRGSIDNAVNDSDWYKEGEKHYCDDCFQGYDDEDNLIIKPII